MIVGALRGRSFFISHRTQFKEKRAATEGRPTKDEGVAFQVSVDWLWGNGPTRRIART